MAEVIIELANMLNPSQIGDLAKIFEHGRFGIIGFVIGLIVIVLGIIVAFITVVILHDRKMEPAKLAPAMQTFAINNV